MTRSLIERSEGLLKVHGRRIHRFYSTNISSRPVIKVYGLLRTGTNYMTGLLDLNFNVFCLFSTEEGWKHGPCKFNEKFKFVFIVKDPYSWVFSFWKWEKIHNRTDSETLTEFLSGPVTQPQLNANWNLVNPITAWNESLRSWRQYQDKDNVIFVRYEDVIGSLSDQLEQIRTKFNLKPNYAEYRNLQARVDNWKTPIPRPKLNPDFYRNKEYLHAFTKHDINLMRQHLDAVLVESFGYKVLNTD